MKHITINTAKMEESIQFYKEITGLEMKVDMREKGGTGRKGLCTYTNHSAQSQHKVFLYQRSQWSNDSVYLRWERTALPSFLITAQGSRAAAQGILW